MRKKISELLKQRTLKIRHGLRFVTRKTMLWLLVSSRHLDKFVRRIEPWGILIVIVAFSADFSERFEERSFKAWQLLTTPASGNSGKREALEYLNSVDGLFCFFDSCLVPLKSQTPLVGVNLSQESLKGAAFLQGVHLAKAELHKVNFAGANLDLANLSESYLVEAILGSTSLRGANLSNSNLRSAYLKEADLKWADLSGTNLSGTNLSNTDLRVAKMRAARTYSHVGLTSVGELDLSGANLLNADLSNIRMDAVNFSSAKLTAVDLSGAWFGSANFHMAILSGSDLSGTDLSSAENLTQGQLDRACGDEHTRKSLLKRFDKTLTINLCSEADWYQGFLEQRKIIDGREITAETLSTVDPY